MPDRKPRHRKDSLESKILRSSIGSFLVFTLCILAVWNMGLPPLGVPGRIPELLELEMENVRSSLDNRLSRIEAWMDAQLLETQGLARIEARDTDLDELFAAGRRDPKADSLRTRFEERYAALRVETGQESRILVLKREDARVLVDSYGLIAGSAFPYASDLKDADSGQFRQASYLYSFAATRTVNGSSLVFVILSPLSPLLDEFRENDASGAKGIGFALVDSNGVLISSLSVPDGDVSFAAGEFLASKEKLEHLAKNGKTGLLMIGTRPLATGIARIELSAHTEVFVIVAAEHAGTLAKIAEDSTAIALLALLLAASASLLIYRRTKKTLSPLAKLHAAVDAFGRSEPMALPEGAPGEIGEITDAFSSLTRRIGTWKSELESEVERRTRMHKLTATLCSIYASDASDRATVASVNIIKTSFRADTVALFYVNANMEFCYCLSGTDFPIMIPETRWRESVRQLAGEPEVARFGPWAPPGMDVQLPSWVSYRLYSVENQEGYIFLGKAKGDWDEEAVRDLVSVEDTIAPIIRVRREREIEERVRQEAEKRLAGNERRLRAFLEGSRDMIYAVDAEDVITEINTAGVNLLRRSGKEDLVGKPFSDFVHNPEDRELLLRRVKEVGYASDYEIVLERGDGSVVFCLETAFAIRNPSGNIIELQGIIKDITDRMSRESALWKTNIELADANLKIQSAQALMVQQEKLASIGQLAAGVAHEINNPLGFLKSNHEMLVKFEKTIRSAWEEVKAGSGAFAAEIERRRNLPYLFSEIDKMFVESDEGFGRIMRIVSNLKSFSRVEQGAEQEPYDVNAGIESTLVVARNEIKYVADVRKDLGELPQINARGGEVNQVILNILVNAAQAIEAQKRKDKGLIEIRTGTAGDHVVITIHDDGPGIPQEIRSRIFDPFFTTKEPGKGTGLGLSISYDIIVSKHGGQLTVDSSPGSGTTFTVELPIAGNARKGEGKGPASVP